MRSVHRFIHSDDGAVAIDWVALAAGLLILGIGVVSLVADDLQSVVDEMETQLAAATEVGTLVNNSGLVPPVDGGPSTSGGGGTGDGASGETPPGDGEGLGEPAGSLGGEDYFSAACDGSTCFMDTTGDGLADKRFDGNSVQNDGSNQSVSDLLAGGFTSPG
ncbi:MAG: hypothetical protein AAF577_15830 [Pseudomonadota bacterium]